MGSEGKRVHIFDSQHLSTGLGILVLRAAELANKGFGSEKILAELDELKNTFRQALLRRTQTISTATDVFPPL